MNENEVLGITLLSCIGFILFAIIFLFTVFCIGSCMHMAYDHCFEKIKLLKH